MQHLPGGYVQNGAAGWECCPYYMVDGLVQTDAAVKDGVVSNKFTRDWVFMTVPASAGIRAVRKGAVVSFTTDRLDYSFSISDLESPVIRQISAGG